MSANTIADTGAMQSDANAAAIAVRRISTEEARLDATRGEPLAAALTDILINCVEGGASVSFMLPLERAKALAFWRGVLQGAARGERVLLVAETGDSRIIGTVQLVTAQPDNQPHRADVAKMLVHRDARRQGVAAQLLAAVDQTARAEQKTVLVLDTVTGSDAERLYQRAGWQMVGVVPNFALMPDGAYCGTTFFHKQLPV
jgi:GNAT superfamily N-acetyltransferase